MNLSLPQVNKIIEIAIVNNQVSHCDEAPKFLTKYMDIYEGELDDKKVEIFKHLIAHTVKFMLIKSGDIVY